MLQRRFLHNEKMYAYSMLIIFLILYFIRLFTGRLITDTYGQPIQNVGLNYTYWILMLTKIPQFIHHHYYFGLAIDIIIPIIALILFFKYDKSYYAIIFISFCFLQNSIAEIYACTHNKMPVAVFIAFFPLCFNKKHFGLALEFSRYFLAFILVSAAYHKFHNGAAYTFSHYYNVLIDQHIDLSLGNPNHISYKISQFLLTSKSYAFIAFSVLISIQISFILVFFTKKADSILFVFFILFVLLTYLIMRIWSIDLLILAPTLLYHYKQTKSD